MPLKSQPKNLHMIKKSSEVLHNKSKTTSSDIDKRKIFIRIAPDDSERHQNSQW